MVHRQKNLSTKKLQRQKLPLYIRMMHLIALLGAEELSHAGGNLSADIDCYFPGILYRILPPTAEKQPYDEAYYDSK